MGLFSSTTKQTTSGTSRAVTNKNTQRTNPQWVEDLVKGFGGEVGGLSGMDPSSLVAGVNPLMEKAGQDAAGLGGLDEAYRGAFDLTAAAGNSAAPRTEFVKSSKMIGDFLDPYLQQVVDTTAADFDTSAGRTRAQQDLDLAGSGAFGGSGAALTKSMTEGELARGRASTLAGLRSQGFSQALGAAQNEAARKQAANDANASLYAGQLDRALNSGRSLADIAGAYGGERRADIATTLGVGDALRSVEGEQRRAPIDLMQARSDLLANLPLDLFGGETMSGTVDTTENSTTKQKSSGSLMSQIGQAAQIAAMFAGSDRTIKRDIEKLYTRPDGLGVYLFRYADDLAKRLWGAGWKVGVMAQEVLKVKPEAVARHPAGFLMVDYAQI